MEMLSSTCPRSIIGPGQEHTARACGEAGHGHVGETFLAGVSRVTEASHSNLYGCPRLQRGLEDAVTPVHLPDHNPAKVVLDAGHWHLEPSTPGPR